MNKFLYFKVIKIQYQRFNCRWYDGTELMIINLIYVIFGNLISALGGDLPGMYNKKL